MRFPSGEETSRALGEWFLAQGIDDEHHALHAILSKELVKTHLKLRFSPSLRKRGKAAKERKIELHIREYPILDGESPAEYNARIDAEAAKRGISSADLLLPYVNVDVTYWDLTGTNLVYATRCHIARFTEEGVLKELSLDFAQKSELEEAIQGLRLLRA